LLIGSWADADRLIDQPFPAVRGVDPVEPGAIRRRLEVLEWDADVHSDGSRTPGASHAVVAPATMVSTFALPSYWTVGDPPMYEDGLARLPPTFLDQIPAPGNKMMVTNWSLTTFRYLRLGEYVESTTTLVRIARKTTRLGEGAFLTLRTEYSDATGEPVASRDLTVFRY
jgi:hydroxyacyl-ACP dehydratase HTD2-like protein with hotdog domain